MKLLTRSSTRVTPMLSWAVDCTRTSWPRTASLPLGGLLMTTLGTPRAGVGVVAPGAPGSKAVRLQPNAANASAASITGKCRHRRS